MKHAAQPIGVATFLFLLTVMLAGCDRAEPSPASTGMPAIRKLPTTQMTLAGKRFTLEVADDDAERMRGLMNRPTLGTDEGMIFIFPDAQRRKFWMKDTFLPLDIVYLDANGTILNIPALYPQDLTNVPSDGPAMFAIELNQGTADRIGLKPGDRIEIPAALRAGVQ